MLPFNRRWQTTIVAVAIATVAAAISVTSGHAAVRNSSAASQDLCAVAVDAEEIRHGIPRRLLTAVSLVEAGKWDAKSGKGRAWPWTVTAEGKGRFFPTKAAAIAAVRRLRSRGITSIDVGCMQVNLHYHPDAFASLDAAFDPARNAAYAAKFLTALKREHSSWQRAVQHYHSSTKEKRIPYQRKVFAAWHKASADRAKTDQKSDTGRIRRIKRQIDRDHRVKVSAYKRERRQLAAGAAKSTSTDNDARQFLSSWPPRDARAQFRAQSLARAWAFEGPARHVRPQTTGK